eukprot:366553-Chlamydomonas_euryale.AAC.13
MGVEIECPTAIVLSQQLHARRTARNSCLHLLVWRKGHDPAPAAAHARDVGSIKFSYSPLCSVVQHRNSMYRCIYNLMWTHLKRCKHAFAQSGRRPAILQPAVLAASVAWPARPVAGASGL